MIHNQDLRELACYRGVGHVHNSFELDGCIYEQMTPKERRVYWWHAVRVCGVVALLFGPLELALAWNGHLYGGLFLALFIICFCAGLCRPHTEALKEYRKRRAEELTQRNAAIRAKRIEEGL